MVELLKTSVPIFEKASVQILRQIYYRKKYKLLQYGDVLFDIGQHCRSILIVVFGQVEIGLTDGEAYQSLDTLGQGSVMGMYGIISGYEWDYKATIKSKRAIIIEIDISIINHERRNFKSLDDTIEQFKKDLGVNGCPQIDYICRYNLKGHDEDLRDKIVNFKKSVLYHQSRTTELTNFHSLYAGYVQTILAKCNRCGKHQYYAKLIKRLSLQNMMRPVT